MTTTKQTAQDRRFEAINELASRYFSTETHTYVGPLDQESMEKIAQEIRGLAKLGRTQRYQDAIEGWARMVEDPDNEIVWSLLQGAVFAGHAA